MLGEISDCCIKTHAAGFQELGLKVQGLGFSWGLGFSGVLVLVWRLETSEIKTWTPSPQTADRPFRLELLRVKGLRFRVEPRPCRDPEARTLHAQSLDLCGA